jgi:hypothetical protein
LLTIGDVIDGYQPVGIPDGIAAFDWNESTVRLFVNHELDAVDGETYALANGLELTGSRVSYFDLDKQNLELRGAGLAFDRARDRDGRTVTNGRQITEAEDSGSAGFEKFCSAAGYAAGEYGFVDDIYFAPEEISSAEGHPHGGSFWALDVRAGELHALPELGRGSWENLAALDTPDTGRADGHVAMLLADDIQTGRAPLYLFIGQKLPDGDFVARNGLSRGRLHAWVPDSGDQDPGDWHGTGTERSGAFVAIESLVPSRAGEDGHDARGYLDDWMLRSAATDAGAFIFSRPEDLHADPNDGTRVVLASTGLGRVFPEDDWGTLYVVDIEWQIGPDGELGALADLSILYDGDDTGDTGIRSPDSVTWARDGWIYVQEDRSTKRHVFGGESGREASIWRLHPDRPDEPQRIAEIDRSVVLPIGSSDRRKARIGAWETSGILDITHLLATGSDQVTLVSAVQAHTITDGAIGGSKRLVQSGQLILISLD